MTIDHIEWAGELFKRHVNKRYLTRECKTCKGERHNGMNESGQLEACSLCIDTKTAFKEWLDYCMKHDVLKKEFHFYLVMAGLVKGNALAPEDKKIDNQKAIMND